VSDGCRREAKNACDLCRRQVLEVAQHECLTIGIRQSCDDAARHLGQRLTVEKFVGTRRDLQLCGRCGVLPVGVESWQILLQRFDGTAGRRAPMHQRGVGGDAVQPRAELRVATKGWKVPVHLEKRVL
jgi:hypothetical protein